MAESKKNRLVGIDLSTSEHDIRIICARCAGGRDRKAGEAVYEDEDWGGYECVCARCGREIPVTLVYPETY